MPVAAVRCRLPGPSPSPSDERTAARAGIGSDIDSALWLLTRAALPRSSVKLLAVLIVVTSVTFTAAAISAWPATVNGDGTEQASTLLRSRLARGRVGQKSSCYVYSSNRRSSTNLLQQPAFGCAIAAPPLLLGRRHWANGVGRRRPCSAALKTARHGESTVRRRYRLCCEWRWNV